LASYLSPSAESAVQIAGIKSTQLRPEWTDQNLDLLRSFANEQGAESYPSDPKAPDMDGQFLWDFIAYKPGQGILLAAKSELLARMGLEAGTRGFVCLTEEVS
jgi:hypothetical protein